MSDKHLSQQNVSGQIFVLKLYNLALDNSGMVPISFSQIERLILRVAKQSYGYSIKGVDSRGTNSENPSSEV
ncbi:MAG: hypothetical protein NWE84_07615 [Candidatus Bathyarchaeota archaeon]|nr:hypothetical protein [Candidatus Bathyarchaeota archaeon]